MKAVILAGGKGSRLGDLTRELPKPMVPVAGKPILQYQIELCREYGIAEVHLVVNHLSQPIEDYFGDGSKFGLKISYFHESEPLGTVGGVKELENQLQEDFLVFYGDVLVKMDLQRLIDFHLRKGADGTLVVHPNDHPFDSDLVDTDEAQKITAVYPKPHTQGFTYHNLVNAAVYLFTPRIFEFLEKGKKADFGKDIFPRVYEELALYAYNTPEYLKDMGTPERLEQVEADVKSGKVEARSLKHPQKAIFLDRDGVINVDTDLIANPEEFELYPRTIPAVRMINESGYLSVVATNQSVVARNRTTIEGLGEIHKKMETLLGDAGAKLDAIYYCPHHPHSGFPEENPAYKIDCHCRKPKPGMLTDAAEAFNIDLSQSYMVGDSERDIQAGQNAGCTTIGVMTGNGMKKGATVPDFFMGDIYDAVNFVLHPPGEELIAGTLELLKGTEKPLVVSIAGNSRSGKSTITRVLEQRLRQARYSTFTIHLDDWILPKEQRKLKDEVYHNFQVGKMEEDLQQILNGRELSFTAYRPHPNRPRDEVNYHYQNQDVIIIEGVVGLATETIRSLSHVKAFVAISEELQYQRFQQFYRWKNYRASDIEQLYKMRKENEFDVIAEHEKYADLSISSGL